MFISLLYLVFFLLILLLQKLDQASCPAAVQGCSAAAQDYLYPVCTSELGQDKNYPGREQKNPGRHVNNAGRQLNNPGGQVNYPEQQVNNPGRQLRSPGRQLFN